MEWVLESFRRVAPEPAGPVLEAGRYSGTQYAYLVIRPPDEAALRNWVRRYEIQGQDTRETTTPRPKPIEAAPEAIEPPVAPSTLTEPARPPVSVTQLLREFDTPARTRVKPKEMPPAQPLPNLSVGGENSGLHAAPPWEPVRTPISPPKKEETYIARRADALGSEYKDKNFTSDGFPSGSTAPTIKDGSRPGEFTSFFQGPFRGDAPSDMPAVTSQPIEAPVKKVGDFTAVFGAVGAKPEETSPSVEEPGSHPAPSNFTAMFRDMDTPPRTFTTSTPLAPPGVLRPQAVEPLLTPSKPKEPVPAPVSATPPPLALPTNPPVVPLPPSPGVATERLPNAKPSSLPGDGATGAFLQPGASEPTPVVPEAPVGPSPYTQIISREKLMAHAAEPAEEEVKAASAPGAGKLTAPAMPKVPSMAPPKMPAVKMPPAPAVPKFTTPAAPKAPKLPKVDAPSSPPVSYWPLIITLTVLFSVAVVIVLYFALKH